MVKKQKVIIFIIMCIFLFSIFQIGHAFASTDTLSLTNVEIVNKSATADISSIAYENKTITNNITFHKVGDTLTYKITVKNNGSENITIKAISDNNTNEYITYKYDSYAGTKLSSNEEKAFNIIVKYSNELTDMSKRDQAFSVDFSFDFEDENGNSKSEEITMNPTTNDNTNITPNQADYKDTTTATSLIPKTGDNISFYIALAIISFVMLIILLGKNYNKSSKSGKKLFSLFIAMAILLPTISKANSITLDISIQNSFKLYDKLVISREINGETIDETINYGDTLPEPEEPSKPGYIFKGWYLDDGTEYNFDTPITDDVTINPKFEIITYDITYNLNGGEVTNPITYTVEDEITLNNPSKQGYTFSGWTGTGLTEKTENVVIDKGSTEARQYTANYIPIQYSISYALNGGTVTNPSTYSIEDEIVLNNPDREGYTFSGWTGTDLTSNTENVTILEGSTGNRTYTANYEANEYTIIFDRNTGLGTMPNQLMAYDENELLTTNTYTKIGYTFNGWNTKVDGTGAAYTDNQEILNLTSENGATITLYAQWIAKNYNIIFNKNGNDITGTMDNQSFSYDEEKSLAINTFSKEGYTFNGWNTKADGSGTSYSDGQNVKNLSIVDDVILYAQWRANVYYIDFHANGGIGTQMERQTILYDEDTTITQNQYTNTNSFFAGWNTNEDGSGTYYIDEQQILNISNADGDIINLYATWKEMKVGDYVDYHPESGNGAGIEYKSSSAPEGTTTTGTFKSNDILKWRIFSISDEGVILVAEKPTTQKVQLSGAYGYINGVKILNDISDIYGHGIGAKNARSIKLEDIEPNFKYIKNTFTTGGFNYGSTKTYTSGKFIVDNNIIKASSSLPQTVTQTVHWYNVNEYTYSRTENETKNKIYNMLCVDIPITNRDDTNPEYSPYWLASETQYIYSTGGVYGMHYIGDMHKLGVAEMGNNALFSFSETTYTFENYVLPIVELKKSIKYTYNNNTENWNINYTPLNYTVSFNNNGGTGTMDDEMFELDEDKSLTKNTLKKAGYIFEGWNTKADGSGNSFEDEEIVNNLTTEANQNITLYAQWREINIGESVDYLTTLNGVDIDNWQVFYKDDDYIYLITKDYIANSAISDGLSLTKANTYNVYGENLQNVISTPSNWSSLLSGSLNGENIDYRISSDSNVKAYGGPSIELFTQSWNSKYPEDFLYISGNENGYYISKDEENLYTEMYLSETTTQGSNLQIIGIKDATHGGITYGYWLSSKSGKEGGQSLLCVGKNIIYTPTTVYNPEIESINPNGSGESQNTYQHLGLRPIICIPLEAF